MERTKINNKGFSLVELIIVIAIMAILAAALAPQLMKYIEKSRVSTDTSTCDSIKSSVNAALGTEANYKVVTDSFSGSTTAKYYIEISFDASGAAEYKVNTALGTFAAPATGAPADFISELSDTCGTIKAPKETGKDRYIIVINATASSTGAAQVGEVEVYTTDNGYGTTTV